ncbi:RING-type domain-containing protein, partial [Caerostris darwini]
GIQEAHQRKFVILAVKKLAEACGKYADIQFFSKDNPQVEVGNEKTISMPSFKNRNVPEKSKKTSARKRKSSEKDIQDEPVEDDSSVAETIIGNNNEIETVKDPYISSNKEIVPANKKSRYSVGDSDSDSDSLPDLNDLLQNSSTSKDDDSMNIEQNIKYNSLPVEHYDLEANENSITPSANKQNADCAPATDSLATPIRDSTSKMPKRTKLNIQNIEESASSSGKNDSKGLNVMRKKEMKGRFNKKNKVALKNKTNEVNVIDAIDTGINVALKTIGEADKNINLTRKKEIRENENSKLIKENKMSENVDLSPGVEMPENTIPSTVEDNVDDKECYNLNEIKLTNLNNAEKNINGENIETLVHFDDITDTAISVQTVASPQTKTELLCRSPGWSKVKQVGKDFRVKNFSKLLVEKNSTNSCPSEMANTDLNSVKHNMTSDESVEGPKFKKICKNSIIKNIHNENPINITTKRGKNSLSECESVEKELTKEQTIESENVFEKSVVLSIEMEQDHSSDINSVKKSRVVNEIPENNHDNFTALNESIHKSDGNYRSKIQNKKNQNDVVNLFLDENSLMNKSKAIHDGHVKENTTEFTKNFKKSSILDERNCNLENPKGSLLAVESNYECRDGYLNKEDMEDDYLDVNNENLKNSRKIISSDDAVVGKELQLQNLTDANYIDEICDQNEVDANVNFYSHKEKENSFVDNNFTKENFCVKKSSANIRNDSGLISKFRQQNKERTKVLKRTCLTLDEIQEAFEKSSISGTTETICSLPFLSDNFRLHVCISEETLNISVLKVVESQCDTLNAIPTEINVFPMAEENVETSHNSPTGLPSSNVVSESSQSDGDFSGCKSNKKNEFYPYLNEYFSNTGSFKPLIREEPLNKSEIIPYPVDSHELQNKKGTSDISVNSKTTPSKKIYGSLKDNEDSAIENLQNENLSDINCSQNLPPTQPYCSNKQNSIEYPSETCDCPQKVSNVKEPAKGISDISTQGKVEPTKTKRQEKCKSPDIVRRKDSDMAYADELVAPLKNIAAKMKAVTSNENQLQQTKTKENNSPQPLAISSEQKSLQEFEQIILNLNKNPTTNDSSIRKPSRLSLKTKQNTKKFRRIQKYDSDDSDSSESSKMESHSVKYPSTRKVTQDVLSEPSKIKINDVPCESLLEQSTLNSFLSEDISNANSSAIAMEIEDLDKKILSVVEKLKKCGREDLLKQDGLAGLQTTFEPPVLKRYDKDCSISDDSEDSTDIFSESVPPTPPDNMSCKNDSFFKSAHNKQN